MRCLPFALILLIAAAVTPAAAQTPRMKIVLDTDIGTDIDDAWALAAVARHPGFELLGVTITDADTPARARVALKLLAAAGRTDVPVAVGRKTEGEAGRVDYQFQWAEDYTARKPVAASAADFLVETARKHPGEVTLLAVGPLQNVADALRKDPQSGRLWKRVVLMGGNVYKSAWSDKPMAEWNVKVSIADAQLVYAAGLPLTIVPLDTTTQVILQEEERTRVAQARTPLTIALEALYRLWLDSPRSRMTLHDQVAVAEAAQPGAFFGRIETLPLRVDDEGFTRIDRENGKPVAVCLEPRRDEFMRFYLDTITRP